MNFFKGWFGELKSTFNMWLFLDSDVYNRVHDIIIPSSNGTSQIDHILVSKFGIFIVETKNKDGWIFGSEDQPQWTQVIYGKKYQFQNPLKQAYRQKKVLADFLHINQSSIRTVVFFVGNCKFKTELPPNVLNSGLSNYIEGFRDIQFSDVEVKNMLQGLEHHQSNSNLTNSDHVKSLRERHSSTTNCPKCGSKLKIRTATKGSNSGSKFLGCGNFPICRFTKAA